MPRDAVRFLRRGRIVERRDFAPAETLLDHLRLRERALGTKEGCAEGDCGACTVAIGKLRDGRLAYEPVNACIQLLGTVDGAEVVTVDDLAPSNGPLHPVQQALVDAHASQCGFCTPGFVMSLFTLYHAGVRADRTAVNDWLAGNLCRCTGYRPIADAALACCSGEPRRRVRETRGRHRPPARRPRRRRGRRRRPGRTLRGKRGHVLRRSRHRRRARGARGPPSGRHPRRRRDRRRPLDHQAASRAPPHRAHREDRLPARGARGGRSGGDRRRRDLRGGGARAPRPRPRRRGDAATPRVEAGARGRHRRRQHRQRLSHRRLGAGSHRPRGHHRASPSRLAADPPARGLLPRLRPPGPGAGRDPDPHRRSAAGTGGALPLLQDLEALRSGHLRPPRRLPLPHRRRTRRPGPHRLRRHGGHPEARPERRAGPPPAYASTSPRPGPPLPRRSPGTSLRSTTTGRAPPTACGSPTRSS